MELILNKDSLKEKAKEIVSLMTLEEKAGLCSGEDCWNTKRIERLGIDSIMTSDGPHGLRKQIGAADNLGIGESIPAVCFPTASALACSFNRDLVYSVGKAMGEECVQENVSVILGPGINQKRSPLCGRNFEYYSEDTLLSGELAASIIQGIQSTGTSASLKHFAVNNQEKRRMTINAVVDERTLRETYLKAFEIAVKKGKPDTVMSSYNRLNGEYSGESKYLITEILRNEWGFDGVVVSDWGAVNDRVAGIKAGLDLEMPGSQGINDRKIIAAVRDKTLSEEDLDKSVCRIIELILKSTLNKKQGYQCDKSAHRQLAVKALEESAVLLKNEEGILPGNVNQSVAVIGEFAKMIRYQGAGSSKINPINVDNPWDSIVEQGVNATYAKGYSLNTRKSHKALSKKEIDEQNALIKEACDTAKGKDMVYIFAGLPEGYESEGFDRKNLYLPLEQSRLIEEVVGCNPNVVVILIGGAPVELPWIDKVKAVLLAYLGGEGVGKAITNLLLGFKTPCGKLAETWPLSLKDTPSFNYFPGGRLTVEHRESIYVGYRYYEKAEKQVLFPFGHGLSYVDFIYSNLMIDCEECNLGDKINITFNITNCGSRFAKETALVFVSHENKTVFLPKKELREFIKVSLNPGETKKVSITLDTNTFGYYNTLINDWYLESGQYQIIIGSSSKNCALQACVYINSPEMPQPDLINIAPTYYNLPNGEFVISKQEFEALYGNSLPVSDNRATRPYTPNNTLEDVRHTFIGKIVNKVAEKVAKGVTEVEKEQEGMMSNMIKEMPFSSLVTSGEGMISENMMLGIVDLLNGHYIKGIKKLLE